MGRRRTIASSVLVLSLLCTPAIAAAQGATAPAASAPASVSPPLATGPVVAPPYAPGVTYVISPKGMHVATVVMKGSRYVVVFDGKEGEPFEEILNTAPEMIDQVDHRGVVTQVVKGMRPIAFSPDGTRHAYTARIGKEAIVILDGKEVHRAPHMLGSQPAVTMLSFSPDGKRLWFFGATSDTFQSFSLWMDGQRGPATNGLPAVRFSADGSRYAYVGEQPRQPEQRFLVVDGKQQEYTGSRPRFTPDGKKLVCVGHAADGKATLLVDGQPMLTAGQIDQFDISATGDIGAIAREPLSEPPALYLNGKKVDSAAGAGHFVFSPDGKRWAALCTGAAGQGGGAAVVDGKRGQDYQQGIEKILFTADSSKCLYVGNAGNKKFVVVDGQEMPGCAVVRVPLTVSERGNGWGFVGGENLGQMTAYINGKSYGPMNDIRSMHLSPDGTRHAFMSNAGAFAEVLFIDGEQQPIGIGDDKRVVFSPDGKHVLVVGRPEKGAGGAVTAAAPNAVYMMLDGQFIPFPPGIGYPQWAGFTPDSRHFVWHGTGPSTADPNKGATYWFVNGTRAAEFDQHAAQGLPVHVAFELNPDASTTVLGRVKGEVTRVTLAPPAGGDVTMMAAESLAAAERAAADAAQKKADAEATAAAKKAEDQKKHEEAVAAQKKAREEALAARKKAYDDKVAARKKAAEDAAAARKKAADDAAAKKQQQQQAQ